MAELYMARSCKQGMLKVVGADLLSVEGDAIVSPADNRLSGLYGLAKTIRDAAGEELTAACRAISIEQRKLNLPPCPPMTTVVTPAFGLADRYKHILHTVARRLCLPAGVLSAVVSDDCLEASR